MINSFSLSFAAADIVSEMLQVNLRLYPLQFPSFGELIEDRKRIGGAVMTDLDKRGLARGGRLDPEVVEAVRLVNFYDRAIAVLGSAGERKIFARLAAAGKQAVLVQMEDQHLKFETIRPESLVHTAVNLLPDLKPGPGQSVTVAKEPPEPKHRAVDDEDRGFFEAVQAPSNSSDARRRAAEAMLDRPRIGAGFFVVSTRDRLGRETQAPGLTWFDTDAGRYLVQAHAGPNGGDSGTYSPADKNRMAQQLQELLDTVGTS
ncbi:ESAT-6 protein secretion system EspG family protein [Herbihabitans rhizosphaerae]|uniref:ESAT-6 protein secretion system EspG family protein n=1 Tax=Herbihabitans rhizosphaerae TaxID=1872711 RepID=A0A4Q7L6E9_9PSEU|nr:ESX secretion-associated protein EspG [Herbihabitans rhizosphaerae]RZS44917.1 ESAT-6 protein secretion system EspG family protein [Herbihabitans rhizosphaerae]